MACVSYETQTPLCVAIAREWACVRLRFASESVLSAQFRLPIHCDTIRISEYLLDPPLAETQRHTRKHMFRAEQCLKLAIVSSCV
jgi:hypothetical protein